MTRRTRGRGRRAPAIPTELELLRVQIENELSSQLPDGLVARFDATPLLESDPELAELERLEDMEDRG